MISVGGVISQLVTIIGRYWLTLYATALIFVPLNCMQFLTPSMPKGAIVTATKAAVIVAQIACGVIVQGALTYAIVGALSGGAFTLREGMRAALRRFFPIVGAAILLYIICGIGLALLVIPAVVAFCIFAQAPVLALVETTGPIASQSRSRQMTRGNRWRILAVLLVVFLPAIVVFGGIFACTAMVTFKAAAAGRGDVAQLAGGLVGLQIVSVASNFILAPLSFAWPAVLYHHLRCAERGAGPRNLAEVFA